MTLEDLRSRLTVLEGRLRHQREQQAALRERWERLIRLCQQERHVLSETVQALRGTVAAQDETIRLMGDRMRRAGLPVPLRLAEREG